MATVIERVRAGATLLDATVPGWAGKIKPKDLDLSDCAGCVIGQLFADSDYLVGCEQLGLEGNRDIDFGFESALSLSWDEWERLSEAEQETHQGSHHAEFLALRSAWLVERALRLGTPEAEEARVKASPVDVGNAWGAL